ncbi:MAG: BatA domain-containing protein [Pirellulaceae bacterium]
MTLLNGLLAFGALAFSIPLVIHLLHRSRFTTIDWGAWHLLDSVIRVNRRRMQIANLLLLLLRCLIPILLAFCLARPVLTGFQALSGDAPRTVVIAIDDSRSMTAANSGEPSRMESAKQGLVELLKGLSRRDEVILVRSSIVHSPPATMGASGAIDKVNKLQATSGPVDLAVLIDAAVAAAEQSSHSQCSVLIVSDFQSCNVGTSTLKSLDGISKRLGNLDTRPAVSFWDFGGQSDKLSNVSVDSVTVDSPAVVAGRSAQYSATLRNAADIPTGDMRVIWTIDNVPLPPRVISIGQRSSATARLSHRIDEPGVTEVNLSVEYGDALPADNRRSIAVDVIREINVVLVDGKPSNRPLEGQADFLSMALSPFAFGGDDQPDSVRAQVIRVRELAKTLQADSPGSVTPDIVVLANVKSLEADSQSALASFVLRGGSLVVFDGDQVRPASYNEAWQSDDGPLTMPAALGEIAGTPGSTESVAATISDLNPQYSPWRLLAAGDQQPLADVEVYAYRKLKLSESPESVAETNTSAQTELSSKSTSQASSADQHDSAGGILLRFSDGSPMVVSAGRGRGQVFQFAVPCDASWTTLPLRLSFLPMMQQMVLDLAGRQKTTTVDVGQPLSIPLAELAPELTPEFIKRLSESSDDKPTEPVRFFVQVPGEAETTMTPTEGSSPELQWLHTSIPGAYVFRSARNPVPAESSGKGEKQIDKQSINELAEDVVTKTLRVVDVPPIESQLRMAAPDRLAAVADKIDATIFTQLSEIQSDDRTRRFGREIWRWLLLALLAAMVGELFLQQHLVGRRTTAGVN